MNLMTRTVTIARASTVRDEGWRTQNQRGTVSGRPDFSPLFSAFAIEDALPEVSPDRSTTPGRPARASRSFRRDSA